jgi:hypothetical protein
MVDDLRSDDGLGSIDGSTRVPRRESSVQRPLADREVPLGGGEAEEARILAPSVHAWLDGELPETTARRGTAARDVEFWNRINTEAERRRRLKTPAHVQAQIMAALPQTAPQIITPWFRREFVITPSAAVTAALALVTATAAITAMVMLAVQ